MAAESKLRRSLSLAGVVAALCLVLLAVFRTRYELGLGDGNAVKLFGVPLEHWFAAWFLSVIALVLAAHGAPESQKHRIPSLLWLTSIAGLAAVMWLVLDQRRLTMSSAWVYRVSAAGVGVLFLISSVSTQTSFIQLLRHATGDFSRILARPSTWVCCFVALGIIGFAPRSGGVPSSPNSFRRWYLRQPRVSVPPLWQPRPITLVELVDYQCPVCKTADNDYRELLDRVSKSHGEAFQFLAIDFPLESECNGGIGNLHLSACEASAGVRLAAEQSSQLRQRVVDWLWEHQSKLTPQFVFDGIEREFGLPLRREYSRILPGISEAASEGRRVGARGTPTLFLNGRKIPTLSPDLMELAIEIELGLVGLLGRGDN